MSELPSILSVELRQMISEIRKFLNAQVSVPDSLKIVAWNAVSVTNKKDKLANFAESHIVNLALISEIWLKPTINFSIPNYYWY